MNTPGTEVDLATRRRRQLFDELLALVLAEGFAGFTLDDLAARLRCSKTTLYALAGSKDDLVRAIVVHFFRGATAAVEERVAQEVSARDRVAAYLAAVGDALAAASPAFMADLDAWPPAREVYERNTRIATSRVKELIHDGVAAGEFRMVNAAFVADLVGSMMVRIQRREVAAATGLDDAAAYRELASLLDAGIRL